MQYYTLDDEEKKKYDNAMNFFKLMSNCQKSGMINIVECEYIINFYKSSGTIVNIKWFQCLVQKIFDLMSVDEKKILIDYLVGRFNKIFETKKLNELKLKKIHKMIIEESKQNLNMKYNSEQKKGIKKIVEFLTDYESKLFVIKGFAGSGKTTTIINTIASLLKNKLICSVVFCGPTNQSVEVLKTKFRAHIYEIYKIYSSEHLASFEDILDKLLELGIKIDFITIHKLLKFQNDFSSIEGNLIFSRSNGDSLINQYELVVVDESSMLQLKILDQIINEIINLTKHKNQYHKVPKLILLGDPAQLPPVNETDSYAFMKSSDDISLGKYIELLKDESSLNSNSNGFSNTEIINKIKYDNFINIMTCSQKILFQKVMRCKNDEIIELCYKIRQWVIENKSPDFSNYINKSNADIYFCLIDSNQKKLDSDWFKKFIEYIGESKKSDQKTISNIIITWTNEQTEIYNSAIRKILFQKEKLSKYEINDILIVSKFYDTNTQDVNPNYLENDTKLETDGLFRTSDQIIVREIEIVKRKSCIFPIKMDKQVVKLQNYKTYKEKYDLLVEELNTKFSREYTCWKLTVQKLNFDTDTDTDTNNTGDKLYDIYAIHELSAESYDADRTMVSEHIKNFRKYLIKKFSSKTDQIDKHIIKYLWKNFHKIYLEPYASLSYGYSITCHKSQGSSYYNVWVDIDDIWKNQRFIEMKKCVYTAVTRTSNEIHLLLR